MTSRHFPILLALVASLTCLNACSVEYSAAPISAQVVDGETGRPVAGVSVVADWQLEGGLEGGNILGAVMVQETESDENGRFTFPAWGPKQVERPPGVYANARVKGRAPGLTLFKSGYEYRELQNYGSPDADAKNLLSDWNGKNIKLIPIHGTPAKYVDQLDWISSSLMTYTASSQRCSAGKPCPAACQWQNIPKTIRAIGRESKKLEADGIRRTTIDQELIANEDVYRRLGCKSTSAVLGGANK